MSFDATGFELVLLNTKKIEGLALWNRKTSGVTFQQFVANLGFSVNRFKHTKSKFMLRVIGLPGLGFQGLKQGP
jgi:hypothetical protein